MKYSAYPKYKKSGVEWLGDVPEHWDVKRLKFLCNNITDGSHSSPEVVHEGLPYVTVRDIDSGKVILENAARISENDFILLERSGCRPQKGDVLFSKDGTIGKTAIVERADFVTLSSLAILKPSKMVFSKYLHFFLQSKQGVQQIESYFSGAALKRITLDVIVNLLCICPPLPEQQAIADFLDCETGRIDALVGKKQKFIELLKEKRTALISHAVTKGLNPNIKMKQSGVEWLGDVPGHWEIKKIKYLTKVISKGTTPSTEGLEILEDGEIRFIKAENIIENQLSSLPEFFIDHKTNIALCRSILEENDVLIVIAGATIGKVAILEKGFLPANTNQAVCFIRLKEKKLSKLFWYYMQSDLIKNLVAINSFQSAQPNISMGLLKELVFPMPPTTEQQAIADFLDKETGKIDALIAKVETAIEKLMEYRTAMLSAAVTGKIDVREVA